MTTLRRSRYHRPALITVAMAVCTAAVAACGSSSSPASTPVVTTTQSVLSAPSSTAASSTPAMSTPATSPTSTAAAGPGGGPVPSGFQAVDATFVSPTQGWVLGSAPCATKPCTSILRTTDGGGHWVGIPAPRAPLNQGGTDGSIGGLAFVSPTVGFVYGQAFYATTDGGTTWQPDSVTGVHAVAVDALVATTGGTWALVEPGTAMGVGSGDQYLVHAAPGSTRFTIVAHPGQALFLHGLTAAGPGVVAFGSRVLYRATGSTVSHVPTPAAEPTGACGEVAASSATALLLVCGAPSSTGVTNRHLYGSTDTGAHWTRLPDPGKGLSYGAAGVAVNADEHAVIGTTAAGVSSLLTTTDGGRTWHTSVTIDVAGLTALAYQSDAVATVVAGPLAATDPQGAGGAAPDAGKLYRSTDGGQTWHAVTF